METPPTPKLDPQSQPWGRWATNAVQAEQNARQSLATQVDLSNKGLAAQLNRLQQQVGDISEVTEDLTERSLAVFEGTPDSGTLTSSSGGAVNFGSSVGISLSVARRMLISVEVQIDSRVSTPASSGSAYSDGQAGVSVSGSPTFIGASGGRQYIGTTLTNNDHILTSIVRRTYIYDMAAGSYTIQPQYTASIVTTGSGSASVRFYGYQLMIQGLEPL